MEPWKCERREQAERIETVLAAAVEGAMDPYEAAIEAHLILQNGGRLARARNGDADPWGEDPRRLILAHMTEWWELRDDLRPRVEDEIRAFARLWGARGAPGIQAEWSHWGKWEHTYGEPFDDEGGNNACPERQKQIKWRRVDLHRVRGVDVERLDLRWCTLDSLDGIERFERLRSLTLIDVRGLRSVREIEHFADLRRLHISTDDPTVTRAVTELDMGRFPEIRTVYLRCFSATGEPLRLETAWIAGARWLRRLELGEFVPAGGSYGHIAEASRLVHVSLMKLPGSDAERLYRALPLTAVHLHEPAPLDA